MTPAHVHSPTAAQRTLIVAHTLGPGGMTRYLGEHATALRALGCTVTIVTPRSDAAAPVLRNAMDAGCGVRHVDVLNSHSLRQAIGELQPDLIRLCTGKAPPNTRLIWALAGARAVVLESVHLPSTRPRVRFMQRLAYRFRPKRGYRVLAFSTGMNAWLASAVPALQPVLRQIRYGLALPTPLPARAAPSPDGRLRLLVLTRLDETQKNTTALLRALAQTPSLRERVTLAIAGDGPHRGQLESLTASLNLGDAVQFEGWTPDPLARLAQADVLVNSTRIESFGRTNVEAAAVGTVVVASRVMGCDESVSDGRSGVLVDPDNPAALAGALLRLADDRAWLSALSKQGPGWAAEFDVTRHAQAILTLAREARAELGLTIG